MSIAQRNSVWKVIFFQILIFNLKILKIQIKYFTTWGELYSTIKNLLKLKKILICMTYSIHDFYKKNEKNQYLFVVPLMSFKCPSKFLDTVCQYTVISIMLKFAIIKWRHCDP